MMHYVAIMHPDPTPHHARIALTDICCLNATVLRHRYHWLRLAGVTAARARAIVLGIVT